MMYMFRLICKPIRETEKETRYFCSTIHGLYFWRTRYGSVPNMNTIQINNVPVYLLQNGRYLNNSPDLHNDVRNPLMQLQCMIDKCLSDDFWMVFYEKYGIIWNVRIKNLLLLIKLVLRKYIPENSQNTN